MESVRACKSRSIHLSLDSRHQPGRVPGNPASNGGDALASLHVYGWTRVSSADRKAVADWRMPTGVVSSLSATVFLHSYSTSLSLFLTLCCAPQGTFYAPCYTFTYVRNVCKWRTWGDVRQQPPGYASTELLKILLLVPPGKEEIYIYIRGSFLEEGRGTSWRNKLV